MDKMFERPDLSELTADQIAPIEAMMPPNWPDIWRDLAISHFITLLSAPGSEVAKPSRLAELAVALALGVVQDLGGSQPYIQMGTVLASSAKMRRVIEMLEKNVSYRDVARATGLTDVRVRQIELEWRRQQIELRQGRLDLG